MAKVADIGALSFRDFCDSVGGPVRAIELGTCLLGERLWETPYPHYHHPVSLPKEGDPVICSITPRNLFPVVAGLVDAIRDGVDRWSIDVAQFMARERGLYAGAARSSFRDALHRLSHRSARSPSILPFVLRRIGMSEALSLAVCCALRSLRSRQIRRATYWKPNDIFSVLCHFAVCEGHDEGRESLNQSNRGYEYQLVCSFCGYKCRCQNGHIIPRCAIVAFGDSGWDGESPRPALGALPDQDGHATHVETTESGNVGWNDDDVRMNILPECAKCNGPPWNGLHSLVRAGYKIEVPTRRSRYYFLRNFSWFVLFWLSGELEFERDWDDLQWYVGFFSVPVSEFQPHHYTWVTEDVSIRNSFITLVALYVDRVQTLARLRSCLPQVPISDFVAFGLGHEDATSARCSNDINHARARVIRARRSGHRVRFRTCVDDMTRDFMALAVTSQ